ncbi:MAG: zinc metallopeptidase [Tyzzerella sp.]|nr:zinc metallopeptidase [Tyzzerella sp.]
MFYPMYFDPTYFLVLIGVVLSLLASGRVKSTFSRYSQVRNSRGLTGAQAAEQVLHTAGIYDVRIEHVRGNLTDHYDPRSKVLRLSDSVYGQTSVAAVGVAAHECGHAIQHAKGYGPLKLRSTLVPVANFGSKLAWPLIIFGLFISGESSRILINAGIIAFLGAVLFQLITLPVEFNASNRAIRMIADSGMMYGEEIKGAKKVLGAAALTYVASAATAILQLLRILILTGGRRRND